MNVPPVSVERVQKCVVNFEIYRFLKKAANLPHPPLFISAGWPPIGDGRSISAVALVSGPGGWRHRVEGWPGLADLRGGPGRSGEVRREAI